MKPKDKSGENILRKSAEELPGTNQFKNSDGLTDPEVRILLQELQIHQIELEMQKEQLLDSFRELKGAVNKYTELYDFAPSGYFTLSPEGEIIRLNFRAAQMVQKERLKLKNSRLGFFIAEESKLIFTDFLDEIFHDKGFASCLVTFSGNGGNPLIAKLDGKVSSDGKSCLISAVDITDLKLAEQRFRESERFLKDTQMIARIGTYSLNIVNNQWDSSEVLDAIFGIDPDFDKSFNGWLSIVHPDWQQTMFEYLFTEVLGKKGPFDKIYKIIRRNDKAGRWVHGLGRLEFDTNQNPTRLIGTISDITEHLKSEEALKKSEILLKSSIESQKDTLIVSIDQQYNYLYFNKVYKDSMKSVYNVDVEVGMNILNCIASEEDRKTAKENYARALAGESHTDLRKYGDAQFNYYESYFNPIHDEYNQIIGATRLSRNVTERRAAEEALRISEEKYRLLADSSPEMIYLIDRTGFIIYINSIAAKILNQNVENVIGKHLNEIFPAHLANSHWENISKVFETGQKIQKEIEEPFSTGKIWIEVRLVPLIDINGDVIAVLGLSNDITFRKMAEEKLRKSENNARALLDAIPDLMFRINRHGIFMDIKAARDELAYQEGSIIGLNIREIMPSEFANTVEHEMSLALQMPELRIFEYNLEIPQKGICEFEARMVACGNDEVVTVVRDITERKKTELEIQLKNIELQKLNVEKDKYLSVIAHDLRTPFNGFLGLTEILANELPQLTMEEIQNFSLMLNKSAVHLYSLLGNLLEWSKLQRGSTVFRPSNYILHEKIAESLKLISESAIKKDIKINLDIPKDLIVFADLDMLQSIIRNLAGNSIKFTPTGGTVHVSARSNSENMVEISIKDSGIGMSNYIVDNLFRLDVNTGRIGTSDEPSTGLGLIICKDLIEKHHGRLFVESEEGKGTTFWFILPPENKK